MSSLDMHALAQPIIQAVHAAEALAAWQTGRLALLSHEAAPPLPYFLSQLTDTLLQRLAIDFPKLSFMACGTYAQGYLLPYGTISVAIASPNAKIPTALQALLEAEPRFALQRHTKAHTPIEAGERIRQRHVAGPTLSTNLHIPWEAEDIFQAYQHLERMPFSSTPDLYHCEGGLCALMQQEELRHLVAHHYGAVASPYEAPLEQQRARLLQFCWQLQCLKGNNTLVLEAPQATQLHSALPHKAYGTVSALLKALYLHTLENQRLMMLEQHFLYEHCQDQQKNFHLINRRFVLRHNQVETSSTLIFKRWPFAIFEMFALPVEEPQVKGFSHQSLVQAWEHRHALQEATTEQNYWFLRLIHRHPNLFKALQMLHRLDLLGQHLPPLAEQKGHWLLGQGIKHPVDVHALLVVQRLQQLIHPTTEATSSATQVSHHLPKPGLLYLTALFHHCYRQRSQNLTAAQAFCERHALAEWETSLILWLIEHQELMLETAKQQDLHQPQTIYAFAQSINSLLHLDYLFLFSLALLPQEHTPQGSMHHRLELLYRRTRKALRRGVHNPVANSHWANETREQAAKLLAEEAVSGLAIRRLWAHIGDEYFLRESPSDIAWHTQAILRHRGTGPLVQLRAPLQPQAAGTQVFIYTKDSDYLFANTVQTLEALGLNVVSANIITSAHGYSLDTYTVVDEAQAPITTPAALEQIQHRLEAALSRPEAFAQNLQPLTQATSTYNTQVQLANSADGFYTVVALQTQDQAGLLTRVAQVFAQLGFNLHHARIATYGERVEDTFHITNQQGLPLGEAEQCQALTQALLHALG